MARHSVFFKNTMEFLAKPLRFGSCIDTKSPAFGQSCCVHNHATEARGLFQGRVYENFRGLRRKIYRFFDTLTIACAHQILFVSKSLEAEFVKELPGVADKARVLGAGPETASVRGPYLQTMFRNRAFLRCRTNWGSPLQIAW